eukprot:1101351-Pyramimonas_sp.AAC.1
MAPLIRPQVRGSGLLKWPRAPASPLAFSGFFLGGCTLRPGFVTRTELAVSAMGALATRAATSADQRSSL